MRRSILLVALLTSAAVQAHDGGVELSNKAKMAAASTASAIMVASEPPAPNAEAPFRRSRDPVAELLLRDEQERRGPAASCETTASSLCYDLADGRIVYRQARAYMPRIDGLRAEAISLRKDRIVLKYSFK